MARILNMPELAESVVEGEIVQWLAAEGDDVAEDQPLVEVMTDKVTVEIPSPFAGVLEARLAQEGDVVPVGGPLARFADAAGAGAGEAPAEGASTPAEEDGDGPGGGRAEAADAGAPAPPVGAPEEADDDGAALTLFSAGPETDDGPLPRIRRPSAGRAGEGERGARTATGAGVAGPSGDAPVAGGAGHGFSRTPRGPWGRPLAVPAARKRARELGIPIEAIDGSGPHGRIRVHDVEAYGAGAGSAPVGAAGTGTDAVRPTYPGSPLRAAPDAPEEVREPLRGLRRAVAKQMTRSHLETVRTLHVDEADVSRLVELRARLKPRAAERGVPLSYLPFVIKALVHALAAFPNLNARFDAEADEVVRYRDVHLGLAVATERGLVVPVIRDASRRTVIDLAAEVGRLADAARRDALAPEEVRGGTFSVTNIGSIGGLFSFPIINAPEAAILGVHSIQRRPVVLEDDSIVPRSMLYLSLSFDHRLVDGAEAARFTRRLVELLEEPEAMLLDA